MGARRATLRRGAAQRAGRDSRRVADRARPQRRRCSQSTQAPDSRDRFCPPVPPTRRTGLGPRDSPSGCGFERHRAQTRTAHSMRTTQGSFLIRLAAWLIRIYRNTRPHFMLPSCRFFPSCSEYARQHLERHGILRSLWPIAFRLLRCQPFSRWGVDPVK